MTETCGNCGFIAIWSADHSRALEITDYTRTTGEVCGTAHHPQAVPFCSQSSQAFNPSPCSNNDDRKATIWQVVNCNQFIKYTPTKSPSEHVDMIGQQQIMELQRTQTAIQAEMHKLTLAIENATALRHEKSESNSESRHVRTVLFGFLFLIATILCGVAGGAAYNYWSSKP